MTSTLDSPFPPASITGEAAIYIRISSHQQEDGVSLDVQLESCRTYCENNGLVIVGEFKDVQSGLVVERPQYQQMLGLAKTGGFNKLIVYRYDRSGRDDAEFAGMLRDFTKLGISLVSASGESPDPLFQKLAGLLAWNESRTLSVRVSAAKMKRYTEGKWNGRAVFGYSLAKHEDTGTYLVRNESQAFLVVELFKRYANGQASMMQLRNYLKDQGITKSRYAIWYLLNNQVYLGRVQHGKATNRSQFQSQAPSEWTDGKHGALIDQETFDRVQSLLKANQRNQRGGPGAKYLFTGLVHCAACGGKFQARTFKRRGDKVYVDYRCQRRQSHGDCNAKTVLEGRIRSAVLPPIESLLRGLKQDDVRSAVREQLSKQAATTGQESQIDGERLLKLERRLSNLEDALLDQDISKARYLPKRDEIVEQITAIRAVENSQPKTVTVDLDQLFAIADTLNVDTLDEESWREIVSNMVDKVVIEGEGGGRDNPAKITVEWKPEYMPLVAVMEG
jgi:site-specific DNA recombinase